MLLTKVPYKEDFKDLLHHIEIILVLPISAAQSEQAASCQNQINSSTRTSLSVSVLEDLIHLGAKFSQIFLPEEHKGGQQQYSTCGRPRFVEHLHTFISGITIFKWPY